MHILVTADTVGGVWTYTRELVSGLALRGIKVTLVSFGGIPTPQQTQWMEDLPNLDYHPTAFKLEWMQDAEADLADSADYLRQIIAETNPDLLHLNQFYYGALECDVPRIVVAHSDVVSWWVAVHGHEPPDSPWMRWYRSMVTRGLKTATSVIAPSQWMLDQVSKHYLNPNLTYFSLPHSVCHSERSEESAFRRCDDTAAREPSTKASDINLKRGSGFVVYNGRTPALFNPHLTKEDLIITIGRHWDRGKNVRLLLQRKMPAPVYIVGADQHPESLGHAFAENLPDGVHLEPQQDERRVSRLLAKGAVYAATSCYEPFGLAPLEAALSRCAIVASDIPPFRELWEGVAVFFRNNDADSLYGALEQLIRDSDLRHRYAALAWEQARQRFNANRMVEAYIAFYKSLATVSAVTA